MNIILKDKNKLELYKAQSLIGLAVDDNIGVFSKQKQRMQSRNIVYAAVLEVKSISGQLSGNDGIIRDSDASINELVKEVLHIINNPKDFKHTQMKRYTVRDRAGGEYVNVVPSIVERVVQLMYYWATDPVVVAYRSGSSVYSYKQYRVDYCIIAINDMHWLNYSYAMRFDLVLLPRADSNSVKWVDITEINGYGLSYYNDILTLPSLNETQLPKFIIDNMPLPGPMSCMIYNCVIRELESHIKKVVPVKFASYGCDVWISVKHEYDIKVVADAVLKFAKSRNIIVSSKYSYPFVADMTQKVGTNFLGWNVAQGISRNGYLVCMSQPSYDVIRGVKSIIHKYITSNYSDEVLLSKLEELNSNILEYYGHGIYARRSLAYLEYFLHLERKKYGRNILMSSDVVILVKRIKPLHVKSRHILISDLGVKSNLYINMNKNQ